MDGEGAAWPVRRVREGEVRERVSSAREGERGSVGFYRGEQGGERALGERKGRGGGSIDGGSFSVDGEG
jgi:hypothetical protein